MYHRFGRKLASPLLTAKFGRARLTSSFWDIAAILFVLLCLATAAHWVARGYGIHEFLTGRKANQELMALWNGIEIGQSQEEVRQQIEARSPVLLKAFMPSLERQREMVSPVGQDIWNVRTHYQLGARNWYLYIEFDAQGEVVWAGIRLADATTVKPASAPPDKVGEGQSAQHERSVDGPSQHESQNRRK